MIKRNYTRLSALFWRNPLVKYRFERGTAYTWENLILLVLTLLFLYTSYIRVRYDLLAIDALNLLPEEAKSTEASFLGVQRWPSVLSISSESSVQPTDSEYAAGIVQVFILISFAILYAFRSLRVSIRRKKHWSFPLQDELMLIPATPGQRLVGLVEWRLWKIAAVWVFCTLLLLLPMRHYPNIEARSWTYQIVPHVNLFMILLSVGLFALIFSFQRLLLAFFLGRKRLWKGIAMAWMPAAFIITFLIAIGFEVGEPDLPLEIFAEIIEGAPLTVSIFFFAAMIIPAWKAMTAGREMLRKEEG